MVILIVDIIKMESLMEEDSIFGKMEHHTKDHSKMAWDKVKGIGQAKMEMNIKVIIVQIVKMGQANSNGWMEIFIKDNFVKICDKEMVRCFGVMEVYIKANGVVVYQMVKVFYMLTK